MEIGFIEERVLTSVGKDGLIRTMESDLTYFTKIVQAQLILVPIGFDTDLGSIPQFLQAIFPKDGEALFAYILHDYLYYTGLFTRSESDDMLREAMKSLNVSWWRIVAVRNGLRIGGWRAWNKHRKANGDIK